MNPRFSRLAIALTALTTALVAAGPATARTDFADPTRAFNILTPGEDGALVPTAHSFDQAKMYDALTPLRGNVTLQNLRGTRYFKPVTFGITGTTKTVVNYKSTSHPGLTIVRDSFNVPHINARTRADAAFGMGFVAAADRNVLIDSGRGPSYVSALSVPGVNAFGLITSATKFTPSAETLAWVHAQVETFRKANAGNQQVYDDFKNYVAGINQWYYKVGGKSPKSYAAWTVDDAFAAFSFIGSIFGNGGGNEVSNANFLAKLQAEYGEAEGLRIFRDFREVNDAESPVSWRGSFPHNVQPTGLTNAGSPGSPVVDANSLDSSVGRNAQVAEKGPRYKRYMSNALLVPATRSLTGTPLAVMGPQLGYFHPEIVQEVDVHGGGYDFRGAVAPVAPYGLIGRSKDYAWSLTSASNDNTDQFLEKLCVPGGASEPTRATRTYLRNGSCVALIHKYAGDLGSARTKTYFWESVHGPISGTVLVGGKPYAVANARATRNREPWSARALADLTTAQVKDETSFYKVANEFETTFNWHYADNKKICFFSSGRLPVRATGVDASLPTLGTGAYDWKGFITQAQHAHGCNPAKVTGDTVSDLILNWNNRPAKDWGAADDEWGYGPVHRMALFQRLFRLKGSKVDLNDVVGVMNQAATEDGRAVLTWPIIKRVLRSADDAPGGATSNAGKVFTAIDDWVTNHDASRLDAALDGKFDFPGVSAWEKAWPKIGKAAIRGRLSAQATNALLDMVGTGGTSGPGPLSGYVSKDLRSILGDTDAPGVANMFHFGYCGAGNVAACREDLWDAVEVAATELTAADAFNTSEAALWLGSAAAERISFKPLNPGGTMRWTNRPTYQSAISFNGHR